MDRQPHLKILMKSNRKASRRRSAAICSASDVDSFAIGAVLNQIHGSGIRKVMASTQYGMGFILAEQGPPDTVGRIVYRSDTMSHDERKRLADAVNDRLPQNAQAMASADTQTQPKETTL